MLKVADQEEQKNPMTCEGCNFLKDINEAHLEREWLCSISPGPMVEIPFGRKFCKEHTGRNEKLGIMSTR